jgi:hypothetical protein
LARLARLLHGPALSRTNYQNTISYDFLRIRFPRQNHFAQRATNGSSHLSELALTGLFALRNGVLPIPMEEHMSSVDEEVMSQTELARQAWEQSGHNTDKAVVLMTRRVMTEPDLREAYLELAVAGWCRQIIIGDFGARNYNTWHENAGTHQEPVEQPDASSDTSDAPKYNFKATPPSRSKEEADRRLVNRLKRSLLDMPLPFSKDRKTLRRATVAEALAAAERLKQTGGTTLAKGLWIESMANVTAEAGQGELGQAVDDQTARELQQSAIERVEATGTHVSESDLEDA